MNHGGLRRLCVLIDARFRKLRQGLIRLLLFPVRFSSCKVAFKSLADCRSPSSSVSSVP
jgi:hypothetical protein